MFQLGSECLCESVRMAALENAKETLRRSIENLHVERISDVCKVCTGVCGQWSFSYLSFLLVGAESVAVTLYTVFTEGTVRIGYF